MNKPAFSALGLSEDVIKAVAALGYEEASPIQAATIPIRFRTSSTTSVCASDMYPPTKNGAK